MKNNKISLLALISTVVIFGMVCTASANDYWNAIHGEYAMNSSGICIFSPGGFNNYVSTGGVSWAGSSMAAGIWTFELNGKGNIAGLQDSLTLPPGVPGYAAPGGASAEFSFEFTYTVSENDTLTIDMVPGTYKQKFLTGPMAGATSTVDKFHLSGNISADHKTITLNSGNEIQVAIMGSGLQLPFLCNIERVLIRLEK
jgi:hypothetical protein